MFSILKSRDHGEDRQTPLKGPSKWQRHFPDCYAFRIYMYSNSLSRVDWHPNPFLKTERKGLNFSSVRDDRWSCMLHSNIFEIVGKMLTGAADRKGT